MADKDEALLKAGQIAAMAEGIRQHQFNDNAIRHTRSLSDALGLTTIGVHLIRVEPGHESTQFHTHHNDEEFVYILSGTGTAELGDETIEIGPGDFMGFKQKSIPHNMINTGTEDLVYLMGGSRSDIDVCDYPRINRRMYRRDGHKEYVDLDNLHDVEN